MVVSFSPKPIKLYETVTKDIFENEIRQNAKPVVLRGLIKDWSCVKDAHPQALFQRLKLLDTGKLQTTNIGKLGVAGAFNYSNDLAGQNYTVKEETVSSALDRLLNTPSPDGTFVSSVIMDDHFRGFSDAHTLDILRKNVSPRAWIGTKTIVHTHFDAAENIACVVLGEREVTLFPPEQLANLYPGPLETAPGGTVVSLTSFENPDFNAHPRFETAMQNAYRTTLKAGDAIYIPFGWWHHIKATAELNMLVNYWWVDQEPLLKDPFNAMMHAMLCFQHLSPEQAKTWQNMFEHFVFKANGDPMAHVPSNRRGIFGGVPKGFEKQASQRLFGLLARSIGIGRQ